MCIGQLVSRSPTWSLFEVEVKSDQKCGGLMIEKPGLQLEMPGLHVIHAGRGFLNLKSHISQITSTNSAALQSYKALIYQVYVSVNFLFPKVDKKQIMFFI